MGYDTLPAPKPILDSYIPLEECTAFELKMDRLRASHVAWLTRQRIALIEQYSLTLHFFNELPLDFRRFRIECEDIQQVSC